jgi:hypothetical protein
VYRAARSCGIPIKGKRAVVVGRSNIVGMPAAMLLNKRDATVTICHSATPKQARPRRTRPHRGPPPPLPGGSPACRTGAVRQATQPLRVPRLAPTFGLVQDMAAIVKEADIVIAAAGQAQLVRGEWIKPGAAIIDVGTNPIDDKTKASRCMRSRCGSVGQRTSGVCCEPMRRGFKGCWAWTELLLLRSTDTAPCRTRGWLRLARRRRAGLRLPASWRRAL